VKKHEPSLQLPVTWKTLLLVMTAFWSAVGFYYLFR